MDQKVNLNKIGWELMFCKQTNIRTHSIFVPYALVSSVLLAIPMSKIISLKHENV